MQIGLNNEREDFVAFQMDLTLPEGVGIDKTECKLSSRITDEEQVLTVGKLESGAYRLTSTSMSFQWAERYAFHPETYGNEELRGRTGNDQ